MVGLDDDVTQKEVAAAGMGAADPATADDYSLWIVIIDLIASRQENPPKQASFAPSTTAEFVYIKQLRPLTMPTCFRATSQAQACPKSYLSLRGRQRRACSYTKDK